MPKRRVDWGHWRRLYVRGDSEVTLESISRIPGAPSLASLKRRSSTEDWPGLRRDFQYQVATRLREIDAEHAAEVRQRHANLGKAMIGLATLGLQTLLEQSKQGEKVVLDDLQITRLARVGAEIERKALGLEELSINFRELKRPEDLAKLSDEELVRLASLAVHREEE